MASLMVLDQAEVHLWRAPLAVDVSTLTALAQHLSQEERQRAAAYRFERHRTCWMAGRGWLRELLAAYLDVEPAGLGFEQDTFGKPRLAARSMGWLRFNVAHSDEVAVFAIARDREVGVDVERLRDDLDIESVARRFLSAGERQALSILAPRLRLRTCFEYWTRKEACLKATGFGLRVPLDQLDVSRPTGEAMRLPGPDPSATEVREWSLHGFDAGPGHVAAVVVEGWAVQVPSIARCIDGSIARPRVSGEACRPR